jgi:selenocysteine-specific elongation factor
VVFKWEDYQLMVEQVKQIIAETGSISVAQMRDKFNTSRRYVLAFLEHLDSIGITVREGDVRIIRG